MSDLVIAYLLHYGHYQTADALRTATAATAGRDAMKPVLLPQKDATWQGEVDGTQTLIRQALRTAILKGKMSDALALVEKHFPDATAAVAPLLLSQLLVEFMRVGDTAGALEAAADERCTTDDGEVHPLVAEAMGLLAYTAPEESPLAHLFDVSQARRVAEAVNATLLSHLGYPPQTTLDLMMKHTLSLPRIARMGNSPLCLK